MPKYGLGRGLAELIPGDVSATPAGGLQEIPLEAITPNPHQPRLTIGADEIAELADSIRAHGILQPLVVTRTAEGQYQLIAGERRWRAARIAGLATVPAVIKEVAPQQMLELALVENVQRADLNALEEALAYQQLATEFNLPQEEIARRVGKSRVAVTNTLRLLQATQTVQQAVMEGHISEGHARALLGLHTPTEQDAALQHVLTQDLNVRQTEALVQRLRGAAPVKAPGPASPDIRALEERFQESLGTRVQLKAGRKGGRVIIYYYSDEEFNALYQRFTGEEL